ncbi:MAG: hypothetical protein E6Q68_06030 [Polynucleobacter sp.]|nr:MAG: hypothetical protein E6Q68_06030 [Polynucleobacter sp.]
MAKRKYFEIAEGEKGDEEIRELNNLSDLLEDTGRYISGEISNERKFYSWEINDGLSWAGLIEPGGFILISGKEKSKKSTFAGMFASAFLCQNYINRNHEDTRIASFREFQKIRCNIRWDAPFLYFDTEQGKNDFTRSQNAIMMNAGYYNGLPLDKKGNPTINYYAYRLILIPDPVKKVQFIFKKIIELGEKFGFIGCVALDVITDFVENQLDDQQAKEFYNELFYLREKYLFDIIGVIHQNRANNQTNGSIGVVSNKRCNYLIQLQKHEIAPGQDYEDGPTTAITEFKRTEEYFKKVMFDFVPNEHGIMLPSFVEETQGLNAYGVVSGMSNQFPTKYKY